MFGNKHIADTQQDINQHEYHISGFGRQIYGITAVNYEGSNNESGASESTNIFHISWSMNINNDDKTQYFKKNVHQQNPTKNHRMWRNLNEPQM